jgi:hypothetical protein
MSNYFRKLPNFEYVSRLPDSKISDYITVKNIFKKNKLSNDIIDDATVFTEYQIKGDDRPDNVAFEVYKDSTLDWLILLCNNIINIQSEWPLLQNDFDRFLLDKYGTYEGLHAVHHYETKEIKDSNGVVIVPQGLQVASDYSITYWDTTTRGYISETDVPDPITNYQYESDIENRKRNIKVLKGIYLGIIRDDMKELMTYKKGGTQYVSTTLKRGENIKLYQ